MKLSASNKVIILLAICAFMHNWNWLHLCQLDQKSIEAKNKLVNPYYIDIPPHILEKKI